MNITTNGIIESFLLAVLVYFLLNAAIDTLITDPNASKMFKIILLIICLVIAFGGGLFIHL